MFIIFLSIIGSLLVFAPNRFFLIELNTALAEYYLAFHFLSLPLLFVLRKRFSKTVLSAFLILLLSLVALHCSVLAPFYLPRDTQRPLLGEHREFSVLLSNVNMSNRSGVQRLEALVKDHNPAIVALLEVDKWWLDHLSFRKLYPYHQELPRGDLFGLALYTRFPMQRTQFSAGTSTPPVILTSLLLGDGESVDFGLIHALPPVDQSLYDESYLLTRRIASFYRHREGRMILAGDLNSTPYGRLYRVVMKGANLRHASEGFGLSRTWNAKFPFLRMTLDHIAHRGGFQVTNYQALSDIGSDHFPVLATFRVLSQELP